MARGGLTRSGRAIHYHLHLDLDLTFGILMTYLLTMYVCTVCNTIVISQRELEILNHGMLRIWE